MHALSKSLRLPREKHFELQKVVGDPGVLTILTSKSPSRHSEVQILPAWTSKNRQNLDFDFQIARSLATAGCKFCGVQLQNVRPKPSVFSGSNFQIALAPQRGANFGHIFGSQPSALARF